ncbi:glucosaminidase domain-containing protein [Ralstonia thomasii]|jgi:hypothetical protein|uniref:Mannosyl-glycoprotein endo-beta-N-acetylglucosamidase-like domain-containing protein n=3 Tax=Ralstonia TaxID=48736 RepID=A0ABM9JVQ8_9RALS|nr:MULTISPECIES: glucosaminidase domain-containing protein [Ralstonia]MBT2181007.1 glucosaminidase domain-containing protein [Ralstonia pickettii]CAJ0710718.1 hypothetical protein LMG7143_01702 [Ralstonia sp. LMG 18095]CAJ0806213.1 hypothetical protein LMG18095_04403 [Ralstonia sp. LMG 18095]
MSDIKKFIQDNLAAAQAVSDKIGVDPSVILGQWGLETGWGKSVVPGTNNLGNIKGPGVAATDNVTGSTDQYRAYQNPQQFSSDFSNLIANKFPGAVGAGPDAGAYAKALKPGQKGGYAEDTNYGSKLADATQSVREARGIDIDPSKISWDNGPNAKTVPSISSGIDPSKVRWDATPSTAPDQIERHAGAAASQPSANPAQPQPSLVDSAMAVPAGIYRGFQGVTDSGVQGAAWLLDKLAGTNYKPSIDAIVNQHNADFNAKYGGENVASRVAQNSNVAGSLAATAPLLSLKAVQGTNTLANAINGAIQGGLAGAATSSQSDAPLVNQVASGAALGGVGNVLLPKIGRVASDAIDAIGNGVNSLAEKLGYVRANPNPFPGGVPFGNASTQGAAAVSAADKPKYVPNGDGTFRQVSPAATSAATSSTSQGTAQAPVTVPKFEAPDIPKPKTSLSVLEQQANIDTMRELGLTSQRQSAITGDKFTAGQEFQHAKLDSPMGEAMREQLANEQGALKKYASQIVSDTGATSTSPEGIGQNVRAPLQALSEHYDNRVRGLYQAADQRAQGAADVNPAGFGKLMDTDSVFAGKAENTALRRGIRAYMKEQGIVGDDGNIQPISAQQAEGMRQYLNSQWSPQNSGLIGKIKESLDMDVAKAGGDDIYAQARALHAERKNTLDNPKGISSLISESGPDGINKAVPDEKIGAKLTSMPTAQFSHVIDTLRNLPDELQPQGQQALAEIKGQLARQIYAAGDRGGTQNGPSMWNASNVTRELNNQASKMALVFSPEEISKFETLNRGGHILQTPSAYPGAAVQGHNILQRGMIWAPAAIGSGLGGAIGHAIGGYPGMVAGTAAGSTFGSSAATKMATRIDAANANKLRALMGNPKPVTK